MYTRASSILSASFVRDVLLGLCCGDIGERKVVGVAHWRVLLPYWHDCSDVRTLGDKLLLPWSRMIEQKV